MKFETVKKDHKKQIIVGVSVLCVLASVVLFTTTRAKYRSTQSVKLANGTVNFKSPDLQLVSINVSEDGSNYTSSNTLPEGDYVFNEEKSKCRIPTDTLTGESAPEASGVSIEYADGKINVRGVTEKNTKCYLYFDKKQELTSKDTLAKLNITNYKTTAPTFSNVATTDEGIYETDDPMYATESNPNSKTYYWRGAATTNYVQFAGKCWRIIRINGDGTIRLIYDGSTCHTNGTITTDSIVKTEQTYSINSSTYDNSSYVGWTYTKGSQRPSDEDSTKMGDSSGIKTATESWFNNNSNFTDAQRKQVAEGKFCNDRRTKDNALWIENGSTSQKYATFKRITEGSRIPSLDCYVGDVYKLKAGAITADEVQFAGASYSAANINYYLYNGQYYWTMSPHSWNGGLAYVFRVYGSLYGYLYWANVNDTNGVRPVINLKADVTISSGDGKQGSPYVVSS